MFARSISTFKPAKSLGIDYRYPLYYFNYDSKHLALALSASHVNDSAVVGWLPHNEGNILSDESISLFKPNELFQQILHKSLSNNLFCNETFQSYALNQKIGYLNINDERVFTHWGRVSDPEDILGTVLVNDGKMVKGTFEPMPTHRLMTRNGLFQLNEDLHALLLKDLE